MAEYIERKAVEKFIENGLNNPDRNKAFGHDAIEIMAEVHYMPAADVAPVVHGRWKCFPDCGCTRCQLCDWSIEEYVEYSYCPHCGAKMDGGKADG